MMDLVATWSGRNAVVQAEMLVSHTEPTVAPDDTWAVVCEWRYKALYSDDWGAPDKRTIPLPAYTDTYTPPGDGWVQLNCYAVQDGKVSWDGYLQEIQIFDDDIVPPHVIGPYADQDDDGYVDQDNDPYEG